MFKFKKFDNELKNKLRDKGLNNSQIDLLEDISKEKFAKQKTLTIQIWICCSLFGLILGLVIGKFI